MRSLGLIVHPRRDLELALGAVREWSERNGMRVVQPPVPGSDREVAAPGEASECDFVVAIGGDGTALAALHAASGASRPVLGVACGSLGALTATSAADIPAALDRMLAGDWRPRQLPALSLDAGSLEGGPRRPLRALNDFVIVRGGAGQVSVRVDVDGEPCVRFAGDGLVVATPLGSSAYTLAAGGPLLAVGDGTLVLTPLAPHGGFCPPVVLGDGAHLEIAVEPGHGGARLEADGREALSLERLATSTFDVRIVPEHATLVTFASQEPLLAGLRRRAIIMDSPRIVARDARDAAAAAAVG